jgi:hypothetical protein
LPNAHTPDDSVLVRYLVGSLPEAEAERLDERSVADDEFALRLSAAEHDLVDAYVNGELSGDTLDRFRSHYLTSPARREKVAFAEALLRYQNRTTAAPRRAVPYWGLAAAAVLFLAAAGYLLVEDLRLRNQVTEARAARAALEERAQQLQRQLDQQRAAAAETQAVPPAVPSQPRRPTLVSLVLLPATRGAGDIPTLIIPAGTDRVALRLELEADAFPRYRAAVTDPPTNQVIYRGANLRAASRGNAKSLTLTLSAALLKPQTYTVDVAGVPARGAAEPVGTYSFRVVVR